ncbi:hypothetical protein [Mycolicibacterium neworleansense]|uniref:Transmembrane protein n=1 Tax=Mycolicibacterium neworleansense TaxID=146018 RepID=A0A0H5SB33_9MYCO|nr:hypothetical protein [Mycolicibacterium neworleansense]MCV7362733.1 hypothetical protein [Mycolicibacterium neworleansense]CRZ18629.1 hypothetical protein BN2156_05534 [Mycolicibacterium neworleansense]
MAESFIERNPWFPGVAVAVGLFILATCITLFLRHRDKDSKHLDYRVMSDTPIFSGSDRPHHLKVTYFDESVSDPRVTFVRLKNTGKQVIRPADVLTKFTISRGQAKLLDTKLMNGSAMDLVHFDRDATTGQLELELKTLNAHDWFELRLIYDGGVSDRLLVSGRLDGQTRPSAVYRERDRKQIIFDVLSGLAAMGLGAGIVIGVSSAVQGFGSNSTSLAVVVTLITCIALAMLALEFITIERD